MYFRNAVKISISFQIYLKNTEARCVNWQLDFNIIFTVTHFPDQQERFRTLFSDLSQWLT